MLDAEALRKQLEKRYGSLSKRVQARVKKIEDATAWLFQNGYVGDRFDEQLDKREYNHPKFKFIPSEHKLIIDGDEVVITQMETRILNTLCQRPNEALSHAFLIEQAGLRRRTSNQEPNTGSLRVWINSLRRNLSHGRTMDGISLGATIILTIHNGGYMLKDPSKQQPARRGI